MIHLHQNLKIQPPKVWVKICLLLRTDVFILYRLKEAESVQILLSWTVIYLPLAGKRIHLPQMLTKRAMIFLLHGEDDIILHHLNLIEGLQNLLARTLIYLHHAGV